MQRTLKYRTNRNLFSNHYLDEYLPQAAGWNDVDRERIEGAFAEIESILDREREQVAAYNKASLEENLIKPVLDCLGITYEVQATVASSGRRPDYAFFADEAARRAGL